jgi:hypothetical protein
MRVHGRFFRQLAGLSFAEMKCAASTGGTLNILLPDLGLSTTGNLRTIRDSFMPQVPILLEKLLLDGDRGFPALAPDSPHIVAFGLASTTSRTSRSIMVHP